MRNRLLPASGVLVLAFLYLPVLVLAVFSFNGGRYTSHWESFSTDWYRTLFAPSSSTDRLAVGLADELDVAQAEIAEAAVDELRRGARRCARRIAAVDERNG